MLQVIIFRKLLPRRRTALFLGVALPYAVLKNVELALQDSPVVEQDKLLVFEHSDLLGGRGLAEVLNGLEGFWANMSAPRRPDRAKKGGGARGGLEEETYVCLLLVVLERCASKGADCDDGEEAGGPDGALDLCVAGGYRRGHGCLYVLVWLLYSGGLESRAAAAD